MFSDDRRNYRLSPGALLDLDDVWRFSAETWSIERADSYFDELVKVFETIAALPTIAREYKEFTPPVRIQVHESHLIVYVLVADHVAVLRLLGVRQDWVSILKAADL